VNSPKLTGSRCKCSGCGEVFSRERAFDRHRVGRYGVDRRCLTLDEMRARGWELNKAGVWVMDKLDNAGLARIRPATHRAAPTPPVASGERLYEATPAPRGAHNNEA
jgi:hypothetical protein